jgi:hypothetical protein
MTDTLKNTWASRIAAVVRRRSTTGERRPRSATNAVPTTTVGRTKGTRVAASIVRRPRNSMRLSTPATGSPTARVSSVESTACHNVKRATLWR